MQPPPCTYQLFILVPRPVTVQIGKLGCFEFPAGGYVYTGSARRNFLARLQRHLSPVKKLHWHIDYLLAAPGVEITATSAFSEPECRINQKIAGEMIVPGFGASDCRAGCGSHLKKIR
jgi:Uri superfamily endonuclease